MKGLILVAIFCFLQTNAKAQAAQPNIIELYKKNTYHVEVWRRFLNEKSGRENHTKPRELVGEGIGFHIGKGHILTAEHIVRRLNRSEKGLFLIVRAPSGELVSDLHMGRCLPTKKGIMTDVCIIKGDISGEGIALPKHNYLFSPNKKHQYGVLLRDDESGREKVLSGKFLEVRKSSKLDRNNILKGIDLFLTNIQTEVGYSGSPVFNLQTGELLGMTTSVSTYNGASGAQVIPVVTIRKYLNNKNWKFEKVPYSKLH